MLPFLALTCALGATGHRASLIFVEFGAGSQGVAQTQTLVRYHFRDGVLVGKENLLTTSKIRFDLGKNQIVGNRYVITWAGNVVDLLTGKPALVSKGELAGIDQKSNAAIIRVNRKDDEGVYSFNFDSKRYKRLQKLGNWAISGERSPNGKRVAAGNSLSIVLYGLDGKSVLLGSDFEREGTLECNSFQSPTFLWLDDTHLLTQRTNGNLVIVDDRGKVEPLLKIPDVEPLPCGPELRRDRGGQIIYSERNGDWLIDVDKRHFESLAWESLGNGFDVEHLQSDTVGQSIRYNGKEIGKWPSDLFEISTAPGLLAVEYGKPGSHLGGVAEGVRVWSADNGEWTPMGPAWVAAVIGWVDE
ncbi:MAG TPA: hypothetical protein VGJ21_19845 [Terracidiphilus sp.]